MAESPKKKETSRGRGDSDTTFLEILADMPEIQQAVAAQGQQQQQQQPQPNLGQSQQPAPGQGGGMHPEVIKAMSQHPEVHQILEQILQEGGASQAPQAPQAAAQPELSVLNRFAIAQNPSLAGFITDRASGGAFRQQGQDNLQYKAQVDLFGKALGGALSLERDDRFGNRQFSPKVDTFQDSRGVPYQMVTLRSADGAERQKPQPLVEGAGPPVGGLYLTRGNPFGIREIGGAPTVVNTLAAGAASTGVGQQPQGAPVGGGPQPAPSPQPAPATPGNLPPAVGDSFAPNVSPGEAKEVAGDTTVLSRLNRTEEMFDELITKGTSDAARMGVSAGRDLPLIGGKVDEFFLSRLGSGADEGAVSRVAARLDNVADVLLRLRSGAQINEQEFQRLRALLPKIGEGVTAAKNKFADFRKEFTSILKTKAQLQPALFTDEVLQAQIGMSRAELLGGITDDDDDTAARALLDEIMNAGKGGR